jgi:C-terminal processing protease CtpA/Prc
MKRTALKLIPTLAAILMACSTLMPTATPTPTPPPTATLIPAPLPTSASAIPDGPVTITGQFKYSNDIITIYYVEQAAALVDMYGFVKRDLEWEMPVGSQVLGFLTLDVQAQTGEYTIQLPARPTATMVDVDNNGRADPGVQILAASYWPNLTGGPYSEGDDPSRGWPSYLASVKTDPENKDEVIGGKLVVWAPDGGQGFPTGFGGDNLLFTADDPVGPIPAGYSIVDLDQSPFKISRQAEPALELYEPPDAAIKDYSDLSYTEAFDKLFAKVSTEWAFNGVRGKEVDWKALKDKIAPRVAEAEKKNDPLAFYQAIHAFSLAIPDGHTGVSGGDVGDQDFINQTSGGYGFALRELDNGKVIATFVSAGGPAEAAGIKPGAEVTRFDDKPIGEAIAGVEPYAGPFSLESSKRYQQVRYLLRTQPDTEATVTFINPGGQGQTVKLKAIAERDSFVVTSIYSGAPVNTFPVEFRILDSGIGYLQVNTNYDDLGLIIRQFEYALRTFAANGVAAVIVDMRYNGGGAPLSLAGFFYDREIPLGQLSYYSEQTGQFEPEGVREKVMPYKQQYQFDKLAVLVGQACASACEIESYGFSQVPGAIVVGMYPSAGVEAEVSRGQFLLPEGISMQIPTGRFTNPDGSIFLEGVGVVPTVRVPITEATVLTDEDVILRAAEDAILGVNPNDIKIEGGPTLGAVETTEAALKANTKALEQVAKERYSPQELAQMNRNFTYTVALDKEQRLTWGWGWCATSQAILDDNYKHIKLEFKASQEIIALDKFFAASDESNGLFCKSYYVVVFNWPGGETKLQTKVTFDQKINDGTADYAAGTQTFEYTVTAL